MTDGDEMIAYLQSNALHCPSVPPRHQRHLFGRSGQVAAAIVVGVILLGLALDPQIAWSFGR